MAVILGKKSNYLTYGVVLILSLMTSWVVFAADVSSVGLVGDGGTNDGGSDSIHLDAFTGATTYQIKIPVPPARGAVQPNIVLNYNSQRKNANSWVGFAWELDLGSIVRVQQDADRQVDYVSGTRFDARFGGQSEQLQLKKTGVDPSQYGYSMPAGYLFDVYEAKIESAYNRYYHIRKGLGEDLGWIVSDKAGNIYRFGDKPNSVEVIEKCPPNADQNECIARKWRSKWLLTSIEDPNGNTTNVAYSDALLPAVVSYQDIQIHFKTPDYSQSSYFPTFMQAFPVARKMGRLLKEIVVYQANGSQLSRLQKFAFGYADNGVSRLSHLVRFTQYGKTDEVSLPETTFDYHDDTGLEWGSLISYTSAVGTGTAGGIGEKVQLIDMNADGLPDRVYATSNGKIYVDFNNGKTFAHWNVGNKDISTWTDPFACNENDLPCKGKIVASINEHQWLFLIDINGDHFPDRIARTFPDPAKPDQAHFMIAFGTGTGWDPNLVEWKDPVTGEFSGTTDHLRGLIDMNADGLVDRIVGDPTAQGFRIYFNNGGGFSIGSVFWKDPVTVAKNGGAGFIRQKNKMGDIAFIRDMNGDGLPDRVWRSYDIKSKQYDFTVAMNNYGLGWALPTLCKPDAGCKFTTNGMDVLSITDPIPNPELKGYVNNLAGWMDFNGDGYLDRVFADYAKKTFTIYFYRGIRYVDNAITLSDPVTLKDPYSSFNGGMLTYVENKEELTFFIDLNGDTLPDRVGVNVGTFGDSYSMIPLELNAVTIFKSPDTWPSFKVSQPANLLKEVKPGTGRRMAIEYAPSSWKSKAFFSEQRLMPFSIPLAHIIYREDYSVGAGVQYPEAERHPNMRWETMYYSGGNVAVRRAKNVGPANPIGGLSANAYRSRFNGFHRVIREAKPLPGEQWEPYTIVTEFHQAKSEVDLPSDMMEPESVVDHAFEHDALSGKVYRTALYENSKLITETINEWNMITPKNGDFDCVGACRVELKKRSKRDWEPGSTQPRTLATSYQYDDAGNVIESVIGSGSSPVRVLTTSYFPPSSFDKPRDIRDRVRMTRTELSGNVYRQSDYAYDTHGNPVMEKMYTDASQGYSINRQFDDTGNIVQEKGFDGVVRELVYDDKGIFPVQETIHGDVPLATTREFNRLNGKVAREIGPQGVGKRIDYDQFGRVLAVFNVDSSGAFKTTQKYAYDYMPIVVDGETSSVVLKASIWNYSSDYNSDSYNRPAAIIYSLGGETLQTCAKSENGKYRIVQSRQYDGGRETLETLPFIKPSCDWLPEITGTLYTTTLSDVRGRPTQIDRPEGDAQSPVGDVLFEYANHNKNGLVTKSIFPGNRIKEEGTNILGETIFVKDEAGKTMDYTYNPAGDLTNVVADGKTLATIVYNRAGQKTQSTDIDTGAMTYLFNEKGQLYRQIDAKNQSMFFDYTQSGELGEKRTYGASGTLASRIHYTYNASDDDNYNVTLGELYKVEEFDGKGNLSRTSRFSYDSQYRRLETMARNIPGVGEFSQINVYDPYGKLKTAVYPFKQRLYYSYTPNGKLETLCSTKACDEERYYSVNPIGGFDDYGAVIHELYGNGVVVDNSYYSNSHRLKSRVIGSGSLTYFHKHYQYDIYANVADVHDDFNQGKDGSLGNLQYDNLNRLLGFTVGSGDEADPHAIVYSPDGNIKSTISKSGALTYEYDAEKIHQVRKVGSAEYNYDANGNMIVDPERTLYYNPDNQLTQVEMKNGSSTHYQYDYTGSRVVKTTISKDPIGKSHASTTHYLGEAIEIRDGEAIFHLYANGRRIATKWVGKVDLAAKNVDSGAGLISWPTINPNAMLPWLAVLIALGWMVMISPPSDSPLRRGRTPSLCKGGLGRVDLATHFLILPLIFTLVFPTWVHAGDAGAEPIPISDAEYFYYIHGDHLGSASILTEGNFKGKHSGLIYKRGQLLQKFEYKPFGQESYVLNPNLWMDPRYTDQGYEIETGLYYYQSRFYNPVLKRFVQPDSIIPDIFDRQSWNRYSYVLNNPLKYTDPTGHYSSSGDGKKELPFYFKDAPSYDKDTFKEGIAEAKAIDRSYGRDDSVWDALVDTGKNEYVGATSSFGFEYAESGGLWQTALDVGHALLDAAGMVPGYGEPFDLLNAGIYALEGDWLSAGLAAGAAVPVFGVGATVAKWGGKAKRTVVIGENMLDRVVPYAEKIGAKYYTPRKSVGEIGLEKALKNNDAWLRRQVKDGAEIIDVGPDVERRLKRGPSEFYEREKQLLDKWQYPYKTP